MQGNFAVVINSCIFFSLLLLLLRSTLLHLHAGLTSSRLRHLLDFINS